MKRIISIAVFTLLITSMFAVSKVEVYYFHYTRRCVTCQAVETESQKAIASLYSKEVKEGKVKFIGVNLDEKESEALAKKFKAEGQALLVTSGNKRMDLTDKGFMYARSKPEVLKAELKKAIDPLLK
ncbi:hypothetical protein SDC9_147164 [bioreactor metagenome]|uniref:Thioredoxin domain-containing protein n=1 Tax=bioreactor metagenome TaxID=1076179 RepID=A0A645EF50_9ZZZZ|nr:nitrophenyl compound nitroreductase subunit ArsF family protein [Paludibacter sp.]